MDKEQRSQQTQLQVKENKITGILKYNVRSLLIQNSFYEKISPGAFKYETVKAIFNHDTSIVLGSTRSNTLRLEDTTEGLKFEIDIPTSRADILESISRKDVEAASFGMQVLDDTWDYSESYPVRTILKAELFEISPTPFPAYEENTVSTRALDQIKNKNKGGKNNMNEQLKKILAMLAAGNTNEEIKAEIETMLSPDTQTQTDPATDAALRSILTNINQNKNKGGNDNMTKEELRAMMGEIQTEETTKGELRSAMFNQTPGAEKVPTEREFRSAFRGIIAGTPGSATELRAIGITTAEGGGYLIGDEFYNKIIELKRGMIDLSKYFNTMPVGSTTGTLPIEVLSDMTPMVVVGAESEENKEGTDPKFKQVTYSIKDMREVYKLANSFVKDQQVDIMGYLARKIALKDVFSTNYYLLNGFGATDGLLTNPLYSHEDLTAIITLDKLQKVINSFDVALRSDLKVVVNNDGYTLLSGLKYTDGRLVMQENATLASGYQILGKEIVEMSPTVLKTDATKGTPFIICHKDAMTIFERAAYEVKSSDIAGFDTDETKVRVIVRKDIKTIDAAASTTLYSPVA